LLAPILPGGGFWGRYQRFSLVGRALGRVADVDALIFLRGEPAADLRALESGAAERWKTQVRLHVCEGAPVNASPWRRWILSPLDFRRQPALGVAGGATQLAALRDRLAALRPDLVLAFGIEMMLPLLALSEPLPAVFLDVDDVPHLRAWREARITRSPVRRWLLRSQVPGLLWAERRATAAARRSFVCSEADRDYLSRRWGLRGVEVLPNAVEIPEPVAESPDPTMLFIGQMDYLPNAAAARFLLDEIWPLVRRRLPRARLMIAGPSTGTLENGGVPEGVELLGVVEDLRDLYARTRVACAPIQAGSGTRIKILEAAAFGRAVVSTRMGAEGLELQHDREILLGDTREELADACCRLLQSPEWAARLGAAARQRVGAHYDSSMVLERMRPLLS